MRAPPTAAAKTERLLNLVICLLYTRRPLTKAQIRAAVAQYEQTASDEAFDRMFERDKDELRDLGIPLVTQHIDTFFEDEPGYRIDGREYALPEISFAPDELAVLALAARTWAQASLAGPAAAALRKLAAAGVERDDSSLIGIEPRVRTTEPAFDDVKEAVVTRRPIRFTYRRPGADAAERHVRPWGLASWHGRWYLTGHDVDRDDARVFRLDRIAGPVRRDGVAGSYDVPVGHQPRAMIRIQSGERTPLTCVVEVREGAGHELRRRAASSRPSARRPGWSALTWTATDLGLLAEDLAGYGPDVAVLEPPALREGVRARLAGALRAHDLGPGPDQPTPSSAGQG